ncbi:hypothetical protein [Vibrio phage vB_VhaM_VH-8]|nr:hypothetical protein [Vibrio phage vB_VhaM_VH-8]
MKTYNTLARVQLNETIEQLNEIVDDALINIYNEYADMNKYERINDNDEHTINDLYSSPYDALLAASYGDYNPNHDYFTYDGYNNLSSFNYADDDNSPIDIEELAQWIVDNELYDSYDLSVTTLDGMLASIEDNITDDEALTYKLADYINESYDNDDIARDIAQWCVVTLYDYDYEQLNDIISLLGIDYK